MDTTNKSDLKTNSENENDNKDFMQDKDMNKNVGADKDKFTISCYGIELPFEWYSMEYILKELGNSKLYFKNVVKMEKATNEKRNYNS